MSKQQQIFLWFGDNDYEIQQQVKTWVSAFEKKHNAINISIFDFNESHSSNSLISDLKNALQVDSLFGSNKFIILKNFLAEKKNKKKLPNEISDLIIKTLSNVSDNFFIVLIEEKEPLKSNKIYKEIQKQVKSGIALSKKYELPKGAMLVKWIISKAKNYNIVLSPEVVNLLCAMIGPDLWQLDLEICKLANYKKDEKVTTEDVNLMVKGKYNDDIFQLMDAISDKDKPKIIQLMQQQLQSGANEMYLLTMLIRQFRIFLQVKELINTQSLTAQQVAKELGIHPYVAKKTLYYLRHFELDELKKIYGKMLDFDIKIKTKGIKFELLFDLLVAEL